MEIDTSQTMQLQAPAANWTNVAGLTGIAAIFLAVAAGNYSLGGTAQALASLGMAAFCLTFASVSAVCIWRGNIVRLTLSPKGLTDSRHGDGEISWSDIQDVRIWRLRRTEQVMLLLSDLYLRKRHPTFFGKLLRLGNRISGGDGILIPHYPFGLSAEKLRDLIKAYADRYSAKSGLV